MYLLQYVQPRPARYNPTIPIFERREHPIDDDESAAVHQSVDAILSEGTVVCGTQLCRRSFISLVHVPPFVRLEPKTEFQSPNECR